MITVALVRPVLGNRILGMVDVVIHEPASFRFAFRNCQWRRDADGERILAPGGVPFELIGHDEFERFQHLVLRAAREHALKFPMSDTAKRKFPLWR